MLDEIIITETPPLCCCYGRIGHQVCVPITGNRGKRIIHGAINIKTGDLSLLITNEWDALTHQFFLEMIRSHWRGWRIILFEDRGTPHTAEDSLELASTCGIQVRFLPRACPEPERDGSFVSVRQRRKLVEPPNTAAGSIVLHLLYP